MKHRTTFVLLGVGLLSAALVPAGIAPGEEAFFDADQIQDGYRDHDDPPWVFASRACDTNPGVRHYDLTVGATAPTWAWTAPVLTGLDLDFDGFIDIANTGAVAVDCFLAPAWLDTTIPPDGILDSQTGPVGAYAPGTLADELFTTFFAPGVDNDGVAGADCDGARDLNGDGTIDHLYVTHDAAGNTDPSGAFAVNPSARTFILDDDAPVTTVTVASANANGWFNTGVALDIEREDPCWLIEYTAVFDNGEHGATVDGAADFTYNVEGDGLHVVEVNSRDYAHNDDAVQVFLIAIDGAAPAAAIESPILALGLGGVFLVGDTVVIEVATDDATSGVDIVAFSDSETGTFAVIGAGAGNGLHTATWTVPAALGIVTLTVSVTDAAGNVAEDSVDVIVLG